MKLTARDRLSRRAIQPPWLHLLYPPGIPLHRRFWNEPPIAAAGFWLVRRLLRWTTP